MSTINLIAWVERIHCVRCFYMFVCYRESLWLCAICSLLPGLHFSGRRNESSFSRPAYKLFSILKLKFFLLIMKALHVPRSPVPGAPTAALEQEEAMVRIVSGGKRHCFY